MKTIRENTEDRTFSSLPTVIRDLEVPWDVYSSMFFESSEQNFGKIYHYQCQRGLVNGTRNSGFSQIAPRQLYVRYFDQLTGKGTKEK